MAGSKMDDVPEDGQGQEQPSLPERIGARISNNGCLLRLFTYPLALLLVPVTAYVILLPATFLPEYIALPLAFALGMIPLGLLVRFPKKETSRFWALSALVWGGVVRFWVA